jgi:hypothetical protein
MDSNTIEHILSAVSGGENSDQNYYQNEMVSYTHDVNHRSPPKIVRLQHNYVKNPSDPVESVSSTENTSPPIPNKFSPEKIISTKVDNNPIRLQNSKPCRKQLPSVQQTVHIEKDAELEASHTSSNSDFENGYIDNPNETVPDTKQLSGAGLKKLQQVIPMHMTSLMGYLIPTSTLYFILMLVVIAIAIYFLTTEKKPTNIDDEKDKDKKKKD